MSDVATVLGGLVGLYVGALVFIGQVTVNKWMRAASARHYQKRRLSEPRSPQKED